MTAPMTSREELLVAGLEQLLAAVHADDPKREILVRIGDAIREAKALTAPAQGKPDHQWTEDELALAFFDYSACSQARCTFKRLGGCHCVHAAYQAVNMVKHVLPRSFPLASPLPSTGLPAPTPHAEVREATYDMRALAKFLYEHCGLSPDKAGKTASEILSEYDVRPLALTQSTERGEVG